MRGKAKRKNRVKRRGEKYLKRTKTTRATTITALLGRDGMKRNRIEEREERTNE